jgi:hypothetical protein
MAGVWSGIGLVLGKELRFQNNPRQNREQRLLNVAFYEQQV